MNLNLKLLISFFNKKFLIQLYFFLFIILNIFDFLNFLSTDFDFFKKLLSWLIIGYIFYSISPTKIFIGLRLKKYDLFYILAFSMIGVVKSLFLYVTYLFDFNSSYLFFYLLKPISGLNLQNLSNFFFLFGIFLIIIISIFLLKNYKVEKKSFLGSFNFSNYLIFMKFHYLILISFAIFFGIIIFNFFMEWFALAVDSIILVLGLIFYIFKYFHDHINGEFSNSLKSISNTGNNFYNKLILTFSDKKTVFIGISLLLTLHLIVDIGVYIVPYSIGTSNSLYFSSLDAPGSEHIPLFNFINPKHSRIYEDFSKANFDILMSSSILIIYLMDIFLVFSLMILPFYILYKNILNKKFNFSKSFAVIFLISVFFILFLSLLNISKPINIDFPKSLNIKGVDINTNSIIESFGTLSNDKMIYSLLISFILFLTIIIFIFLRYNKYEFYFKKLIYIIVLLFFIYYILIFFFSVIEKEYDDLFGSNLIYNTYNDIYLNNSLYKSKPYDLNTKNLNVNYIGFSSLNLKNISLNISHNDYILIKSENLNLINNLKFKDNSKLFKNLNNDSELIYFLGKNYFDIEKINRGYKIVDNLGLSKITGIIFIKNIYNSIWDFLLKLIEYLRLIFLSIFYIFGILTFIYHYSKTNILN